MATWKKVLLEGDPPGSHNHDSDYVELSGDTMSGNLVITKSDAKVQVEESTGASGYMIAQGIGSGLSLTTSTQSPIHLATNSTGPSTDYSIKLDKDSKDVEFAGNVEIDGNLTVEHNKYFGSKDAAGNVHSLMKLHSTDYMLLRSGGNGIRITNAAGETNYLMTILDGGQVGIGQGSVNPTYKLDVLHAGDDQFRVGRSAAKHVAIRDDVMLFTGMTSNGMRIQTSDNSHIKFSSGTGKTIFDYAGAGGPVAIYSKLGIGHDSPSQPLHIKVDNNNSDPHFFIENANSGGRSHARFYNSSRNTYWSFGQDSDDSFKIGNSVHFGTASTIKFKLTNTTASFGSGTPWEFTDAWTGVIKHGGNPFLNINSGSNGALTFGVGNRKVNIGGVLDLGSDKVKFTPNTTSGNVMDIYSYGGINWDIRGFYSEKFKINYNDVANPITETADYKTAFCIIPSATNRGNVGIGTDSPVTILDIKGSGASTDINLRTQDDTVETQYEGARVRFAKSGDGFLGHVGYRYYSATNRGVELYSSNDINFKVNGADTNSVTIKNTGRVAIGGFSDPPARLTIRGSDGSSGTHDFQIQNSSGNTVFSVNNEGSVNIGAGPGSYSSTYDAMVHGGLKVTSTMYLNQNNKYAWGNGTVWIQGNEADGMQFYASSTNILSVTHASNLGVSGTAKRSIGSATSSGTGDRTITVSSHGMLVGDAVRLPSGNGGADEIFTIASVTDTNVFVVDSDLTSGIDSDTIYKDGDLFKLNNADATTKVLVNKTGHFQVGADAPSSGYISRITGGLEAVGNGSWSIVGSSGNMLSLGNIYTSGDLYLGYNQSSDHWVRHTTSGKNIGLKALGSGELKFQTYGVDRMRIDSAGKVGIGTTSPLNKLTLKQSTASLRFQTANTDAGICGMEFTHDSSESNGSSYAVKNAIVSSADSAGNPGWARADMHFVLDNVSDSSSYLVGDRDAGTMGDTKMIITHEGKVGIGTVSPSQPLHVYSNNNNSDPSVLIDNDNAGGSCGLGFLSGTSTNYTIGVAKTGENFRIAVGSNLSSSPSAIDIKNNGMVGIGTTDPIKPLHVSSTDNCPLLLDRTTTDASGGALSNQIDFRLATANDTMYTHGTIGYYAGETWDDTKFFQMIMNGGAGQTIAENIRGNTWKWYTGGTQRMTIDSSGRVGIGVTNPNQALQVQGIIKAHESGDAHSMNMRHDELFSVNCNLHMNWASAKHIIMMGGTSTGNVGIGITPTQKLHVSGNILSSGIVDAVNYKINGGQGSDGQVLTSTGSGVAWEAVPTGGTAEGLDSSGDVTIDADGGDVFFKDDGVSFARINNSGPGANLRIMTGSGEATAMDFSGGNVRVYDKLGIGADAANNIPAKLSVRSAANEVAFKVWSSMGSGQSTPLADISSYDTGFGHNLLNMTQKGTGKGILLQNENASGGNALEVVNLSNSGQGIFIDQNGVSADALKISKDGTQRAIHIDHNMNVGTGITSDGIYVDYDKTVATTSGTANITGVNIAVNDAQSSSAGTTVNTTGLKVHMDIAGGTKSGTHNNYAAAFTGGHVGIGTVSPENDLTVEGTGNAPVTIKSFGTNVSAGISLMSSKGTAASPTDINANNYKISQINFMGRESNGDRPGASIEAWTAGVWTGGGQATNIRFYTGDGTQYAMEERVRITHEGRLLAGGNTDIGAHDATSFSAQFKDTAGTNAIHQFGQFYTNFRSEPASIQLGRHGGTSSSRAVIANSGAGSGTILGRLQFRGLSPSGGGSSFHLSGEISCATDQNFDTNSAPGALIFSTHKDWATSGSGATEWMRITSSGKVGIGKSAPTQPLEVNLAQPNDLVHFWHGNNAALIIKRIGGDDTLIRQERAYDSIISIQTAADTTTAMGFHVKGQGHTVGSYVGIGTNDPANELEIGDGKFAISGASISQPATAEADTKTVFRISTAYSTKGGTNMLAFTDDDGTTGVIPFRLRAMHPLSQSVTTPAIVLEGNRYDGGANFRDMQDDRTLLQIRNHNAAKVTVMGSGKMGIGTVEPDHMLHTYGSTGIKMEATNENTSMRLMVEGPWGSSNGGDGGFQNMVLDATGTQRATMAMRRVKTAANGDTVGDYIYEWWAANADSYENIRMKMNRTGLGIGTQNPTSKLHVAGNAEFVTGGHTWKINNYTFGTTSSSDWELLAGGSAKMVIFNAGNIRVNNKLGIGNLGTDIDYELDVQGSIRIADAIYGFHDGPSGRTYGRKWTQYGPNVQHFASGTDREVTFYADSPYTDKPILKIGGGSGYTRRVGINTTAPACDLHVKSPSAHASIKLESGSVDHQTYLVMEADRGSADDTIANIQFTVAGTLAGAITAIRGDADNKADLAFHTTGSERMRIMDDGKVGIGIEYPSYQLELSRTEGGELNLRRSHHDITAGDDIGVIYFTGRDDGSASSANIGAKILAECPTATQWGINADVHDAPTDLKFYTQSDGGVNGLYTPNMVINSDGDVGIGVTSPEEKLHISGSGANMRLESTDSNNATFQMYANGGSRMFLQATGTTSVVGAESIPLQIRSSGATNPLVFSTYDSGWYDRMIIKNTGEVGIGTTPTQKLHVHGHIRQTTASGDGKFLLESAGNTIFHSPVAGKDITFKLRQTSSEYDLLHLDATDQRVGIGNTTPESKLHVTGTVKVSSLATFQGARVEHASDACKATFGAGNDASIYYDGQHFQFNSQDVGSGEYVFSGGPIKVANTIKGHNTLEMVAIGSNPQTVTGRAHLYAKTNIGTDMFVQDSGGNVTQISPHDENGEWVYNSKNIKTKIRKKIRMEKLIRKLEDFFGEEFIEEVLETT